ncbi:MAG TPA: DUF4034 domain-containing protein [Tepidisphaeraceae bacterium]|jgi:tetratricopeptide (TPR) repeat protein|nr:DUF4034 domain-containing protein [Tepidisphaeraceae bacterium]
MKKGIWVGMVVVMLVGMGAVRRAATRPTTRRLNLEKLIEKLGSADSVEREEAVKRAVFAYPGHEEEIEAAAQRTGLDPQAQLELQQIVAMQKPRMEAKKRAERIGDENERLNRDSALAAYDKVGIHDPAWDDAARELIKEFTLVQRKWEPNEQHLVKMSALAEKISKAGCKDPFIRYLIVRTKEMEPVGMDGATLGVEFKQVVGDLEESGYPADRKCQGHARYVDMILRKELTGSLGNWKTELGGELQQAVKEWPEVVKSAGINDEMLGDLANVLENDWVNVMGKEEGKKGDRAELCEKLVPAWVEAYPKAVGPWVFKGQAYVGYAWDARGDGWGNTVTADGSKAMGERLKVARAALEKAYELDPKDARGPTEMISVELGEGNGRAEMEKWWKRAMDANPDNYQACSNKLYYLEPKWYGSPGEMIAFGRECLSEGNWEGRIPFILVDAHMQLSKYPSAGKGDYFAQPEVWKDIRSVYGPFLERYSTAVWDRSYYAYYATRCGEWGVAKKQFEVLGNKVDLTPFGNREAYEFLVKKANAMSEGEK